MTTDFRALCADLLWALENAIRIIYREDGTKHISTVNPIVNRARAALADEPEGREPVAVTGQPSDEELLALVPQGSESDFCLPRGLPSDWVDGDFIAPPEAVVAFARAVLARFGHQSAPPADGEVGELVQQLHHAAEVDGWDGASPEWCQSMLRAAELLQRQVLVPEVK